jgi:hypothetical protein
MEKIGTENREWGIERKARRLHRFPIPHSRFPENGQSPGAFAPRLGWNLQLSDTEIRVNPTL